MEHYIPPDMKTASAIILVFLAASAPAFFSWGVDIEVTSGDNLSALTFGADSAATAGYYPWIDVPTFPTPSGRYAYFPVDDSSYPGYTMLGSDFRFPSRDTIFWNLALAGGAGFAIRWDPSALPDSGEYFIGPLDLASLPDTVILEWTDMRAADSLFINLVGGRIRALGSPVSPVAESPRPQSKELAIYPNPFNARCRIRGEGSIEIYDVSGKLVSIIEGDTIWEPSPELPSGVYLIKSPRGETGTAILLR